MALFCLGKEFAIISLKCLVTLDQCGFKQEPGLFPAELSGERAACPKQRVCGFKQEP